MNKSGALAVVLLLAILAGGCTSDSVTRRKENYQERNLEGISFLQCYHSAGEGNINFLCAKTEGIYFVYASPAVFTNDEFESLIAVAQRVKERNYQKLLRAAIKAGIPSGDQEGFLFRLTNSVFWCFFSKNGAIYCQISDTKDPKTLQNPWVKQSSEQARQFFLGALLIKERMDKSEAKQAEGLR
jgi:hypothetical protein